MKHARIDIRIQPTPGKPGRYSVARVDKSGKVAEWLETPGGRPQTTSSPSHAKYLADRFAEKGNEEWLGPNTRRRR